MIGQHTLMDELAKQINNKKFPRFSIIVGATGSGRHLVVDEIGKMLEAPRVFMGTAVNNIREMIDMAYKTVAPLVFVIHDADAMSVAAKNALLKVTEEPPNSAYFILTLNDLNNTLPTIRSRGTTYFMENYTPSELLQFGNQQLDRPLTKDEETIITSLCCNPGEVKTLLELDMMEFYKFVELVVDHVATSSVANALKIGTKLQLKEGVEGKYPLLLFWRAFSAVCADRMTELETDFTQYIAAIQTTSKYMQELNVVGINKQNLFDTWVLDVRKAVKQWT